MNLEIMTMISGLALLAVFALVGWNLQRKRSQAEKTGNKTAQNDD